MIDHWLQRGNLYIPDGSRRCFNPGNNELLGLWLVAPFSGDFYIHLCNVLPVVLLVSSVACICAEMGLSKYWSNLCALASVFHYVTLQQLVNAQNDVGAAASFSACLYYIIRHQRTNSTFILFLGAISLGILAGVKYYALGYALLLFAVWAALNWRQHGWRAYRPALLISVGFASLGGYWYVRNAVVAGSPFYPKGFLGSPDLFSMIYPDIISTSFLGNRRTELPGLYLAAVWNMVGPCAALALLSTPFTLLWLAYLALFPGRVPYSVRNEHANGVLATVLIGAGFLFSITPMAVENNPGTLNQLRMGYCPARYSLCFLIVATLSLLVAIKGAYVYLCFRWRSAVFFVGSRTLKLVNKAPAIVRVLGTTAVFAQMAGAVFLVWRRSGEGAALTLAESPLFTEFLVAGNAYCLFILYMVLTRLWPQRTPLVNRSYFFGLVILTVSFSMYLSNRWHAEFSEHYNNIDAGKGVDVLAGIDEGAKICVLKARYYPYFGSRRQYLVCKPYYVPSAAWLRTYFDNRGVRFVAAVFRFNNKGRAGEAKRMSARFKECYDENPENFELLADAEGDVFVGVLRAAAVPANRRATSLSR